MASAYPAVAELVMLSFGYLLLIEPVVSLWYRTLSHSTTSSSAQGAALPSWTSLLKRFLRIMLLGSFITGIVASCQTSSSFNNSGNVIHSALDLRHASYLLALSECSLHSLIRATPPDAPFPSRREHPARRHPRLAAAVPPRHTPLGIPRTHHPLSPRRGDLPRGPDVLIPSDR